MWDPRFGYTYARDYGILARFRVVRDRLAEEGQEFYNYFIGGIRGLGTWGVGWYIDHRSTELGQLAELSSAANDMSSGDIQVLLEVEYRNYRIVDVADVSDKTQAFFESGSVMIMFNLLIKQVWTFHRPNVTSRCVIIATARLMLFQMVKG